MFAFAAAMAKNLLPDKISKSAPKTKQKMRKINAR